MAASAGPIDDRNALMRAMMKSALERMLDAERDHHLAASRVAVTPNTEAGDAAPPPARPNRRNGRSKKAVPGDLGPIPLDTPRDRDGTFAPQLIPKHQRRLTGFDDTILALSAKGMTTRDIQDLVQELSVVEVSPALVSQITADRDADVTAWRTRRLEAVWPIVSLNGLVVRVRGGDGRVSPHTMSAAVGVNVHGKKELLGLWLGETEGAKFWRPCLTDLNNRGVTDRLVACIDGRTGFPEAIRTAYPHTKVQLCIVHLVRVALKSVTGTDSRKVVTDLKAIDTSATVPEAERAFATFADVWGDKDPTIVRQWRLKWPDLIAMFEFPAPIRRAMDTTNAIESVNRVIRKVTRNRKPCPNAESALTLVCLAIHEASQTWAMPIAGWKAALNHYAIVFEGRGPPNAMGGQQHPRPTPLTQNLSQAPPNTPDPTSFTGPDRHEPSPSVSQALTATAAPNTLDTTPVPRPRGFASAGPHARPKNCSPASVRTRRDCYSS